VSGYDPSMAPPRTDRATAAAATAAAPQISGETIAAISRFPDENPNPVLRMLLDGRLLYANPASRPVVDAMGAVVGSPVPERWLKAIDAAVVSGLPFEVPVGAGTIEILAVAVPDLGFVNLYGTDVTARKAVVKFPDQNPNPVFRLDTVNLASRMESTGVPGRVQVTAAVEERLRGRFPLEPRGLVDVKGKGRIPTWFLG
jgi:hypothetical protein